MTARRRSRQRTSRAPRCTTPARRGPGAPSDGRRADHHRGRLARHVQHDRGGGAGMMRAVIDAGQHDQRGDRRHLEGERQQHGDRGRAVRGRAARRPGCRGSRRPGNTRRFAGVSATWKPAMMLPRMCISVAASSRQQIARRQPQPIDEDAARDGAKREDGQHDFDGAKARAGSTCAQHQPQHRH